ncbi:MAG: 4-(cytidine 5'-diphospho)-2-C-methyl-D-erythritol kinase [Rhabdochlamydiaceae bacterium]|nr:4-(cytidine 5'-diphospho)-2-C-methyl-D-erythritol kinase [Rhabdochlamydiaceae bacterium]
MNVRSPEPISFVSPAKINLFFQVLSRRDDGYHEIFSLYQAISLKDTLSISLSLHDKLTCTDPNLPCDDSNLIIKALQTYRKKTGFCSPVAIHLEKNIPVQSGLGGGSGNAATMLFALNTLNPHPVSEHALASFAAEFSSDAPFFFSSGTAYCKGRGEIIESLPARAPMHLWIAKPQEGLSTPAVYRAIREEFFTASFDKTTLDPLSHNSSVGLYFNDLEIPAFQLLPKLSVLRDQLYALGFTTVVMSGSGTAFFCIGELSSPSLPDVHFYPVSFLNRKEGAWYD